MNWLQALPPAICYFLFNWQFFRCVESIMDLTPLHKQGILSTFLVNYSVFTLCSLLKLHLIVNWIVFLFLLLAEQLLLYRQPLRKSLLFSLLGTQMGLAINILCRSLLAIILDIPLVAFDNSIFDPGNLKRYPILLGFLITGLLFFLIARFHLLNRLTIIMEDRNTLIFLIGLLIAMYFYLCMNLMVYYVQDNGLIFKLWSMKSSIFVIVGECLSVVLSIRLGEISVYRAKSQQSQAQLAKERSRERELHIIASTDPLTGCENRLQVMPCLKAALEASRAFCLCFVDMNGLKSVNDKFGHQMGDKYIQAVADVLGDLCNHGDFLFRYGGDEFLLLLFDAARSDAAARLALAQQQLEQTCRRHGYPFPAGISYGISTPTDGKNEAELIEAADAQMYKMKQAVHAKPAER